ncbi:MAG: undecaprenyldiphospho-muramoylpentapeptide beta-N-acetylglucosaminyltransferase [Bacteroidetes bacterium]|nr:MAG: undecaprenyldiphospho-muramoylpentapeptide beta-N-acetylglucosaminyltransferase [Bacteroidota bacterium]
MSQRIIIAGGGTGGHIFPAIAVANAIKSVAPNASILFVGAQGKMEMEKVPQAGYHIKGLSIAGFNRSSLVKNIGLPFKLIKSFLQVRKILRQFKPNAVFGVGGYSSYPVLRMAQASGIDTYLHESNAFAGKSNILLGKKAKKIFVAAAGMETFFAAEKLMVTGNPVRSSIANITATAAQGKSEFGLDPNKPVLFVMGGSLGAKSINEAIASNLPALEAAGVQLLWQTGKPFLAEAKLAALGKSNIWVGDFITDMPLAYAAADVVISRSGAMSVAELCMVAKPTIFVPYPFAAEDHQTANAMALVNQQAAMLITNHDAKDKLVSTALQLITDVELCKQLSFNIKKMAKPNADVTIAKFILQHIK